MFHDELLCHRAFLQGGCLQHGQQAAVQQEPRLCGVAQHTEVVGGCAPPGWRRGVSGLLRGQRQPGEVDMCRNVLEPHVHQRISVHTMRLMAHHRAHVALQVVVLALGKTVVDKERRALLQSVSQRPYKTFGGWMDFGQIVVCTLNVDRGAQSADSVAPTQRVARPDLHAALIPNGVLANQQFDWHGIEHFVTDDHPSQPLRQFAYPTHLGTISSEHSSLAMAQSTRQIDDGVTV